MLRHLTPYNKHDEMCLKEKKHTIQAIFPPNQPMIVLERGKNTNPRLTGHTHDTTKLGISILHDHTDI
uniref:Uncharacterized protein n=1 Tax=Arundo donax TaxID=35708 RepID=A0A0A9HZA1_ARUDO